MAIDVPLLKAYILTDKHNTYWNRVVYPTGDKFTLGTSENFYSPNLVHGTALSALSRCHSLVGEKDFDIGVALREVQQPLLKAVM